MQNFVHPDFQFQYPDTWTLDTSRSLGQEVSVFSPTENEEDNFCENVNVLIQDLTGLDIDLEKYKQITDQQVNELAVDGQIIESTIVQTVQGQIYRIIYTMTQGMFNLKINSLCLIRHEKAYLITFCTKRDDYEQYKIVGEEILNSFTLKN